MIGGIICGILSMISIGTINFGEIFFILYGIFNLQKEKLKVNNTIKKYIWFTILFLIITGGYYFFDIICKDYIFKNIFKYFDMFIITLLSYFLYEKNSKKLLNFFLAIICTGMAISLFTENFANIGAYLHYNLFLLVIYLLILKNSTNNKVCFSLLVVGFILSIISHSRTSLFIICITVLYEIYQSLIKKQNMSFNKKLKKIIILSFLVLLVIISFSYFIENFSFSSASNLERRLLLETATTEIKNNLLFGVGPGNFNIYGSQILGVRFSSTELTTHNYFLQIIAEWGIVGFIIYMIPLLQLLLSLLKKKVADNKNRYIYIYYFIFLFFNVVSGSSRLIFGIILGIIFGIHVKEVNLNEECNSHTKLQ